MALEKVKIINICDKIVLSSLYIIAFFLPISKAIIEIFSTLAIICYIVKKLIQRENFPKSQLNLPISAYLIICFISIFISSNLKISARIFWGKTIQDILFFFVVADTLKSERRLMNFFYILFFSSLILGIDGLYQYATHKDFIRHRLYVGKTRIHATFPTPNDFGCYLVTVITFVLACFFAKLSFKQLRFIFTGLFMILFACLILTASRGAWFAFMSAALFISIWIRMLGVFFLGLGIFIMATQQFYSPLLKERLGNFFIFGDVSSIDRKVIWGVAWKMIKYRPLMGLGIGTFMFNFNKFVNGNYTYGLIPYAHNCYLQIASETGLIGLILFLSIIALFFYFGIKALNINGRQKTFFWYALLASLASVLGYSVQMAVDTIYYSLDLGILFWMLLGLGVAAMNNIRLGVNRP